MSCYLFPPRTHKRKLHASSVLFLSLRLFRTFTQTFILNTIWSIISCLISGEWQVFTGSGLVTIHLTPLGRDDPLFFLCVLFLNACQLWSLLLPIIVWNGAIWEVVTIVSSWGSPSFGVDVLKQLHPTPQGFVQHLVSSSLHFFGAWCHFIKLRSSTLHFWASCFCYSSFFGLVCFYTSGLFSVHGSVNFIQLEPFSGEIVK